MISNRLVSRQHAVLTLRAERLFLEDLGSANGTQVNGEVISGPRAVTKGDVIRVGSEFLEVDVAEESPRLPAPTGQRPAEDLGQDLTNPAHSSLELIEALVSSAAENPQRESTAQTIQNAIDLLVRAQQEGAATLTDAQIARLVAVVEIVAGWFPGGNWGAWRDQIREQIGH